MKHQAVQHCVRVVWSVHARLLPIVVKPPKFLRVMHALCAHCAKTRPVCMGKTLFRGMLYFFWGGGMQHTNKVLHCNLLSSFVSTAYMSMNPELLEPSNGVSYHSTMNERVSTTIVVPSSTPNYVAIQYERFGHSQLFTGCPPDYLMFPMLCAESS